ncbi:MAG: transposase [Desulfovibrionaceae bacterium]|nr:transposase [Desulfovibrionaceae bacterium]
MYAGKTGIVQIPSVGEHEKIITLPNGYIYYATESHWDKEKGRMVDNRVGIGKIDPEHPGMMFPGKRFKEFFEYSPVDNENSSLFEPHCPRKRQKAGMLDVMLSYAPFAVLEKTAELSGMLPALKQAMPQWWKEILALAAHAVIEQSTVQSFRGWAFDTWCGLKKLPSDSTISRMYSDMAANSACIEQFFALYLKEFHSVFPRSRDSVLAFDSSDHATLSRGQENIIHTALYVDEETGISLWYEYFDGCVLDKTETPYSMEKAEHLGCTKVFAMIDRGYYSEANARRATQLGIDFAMMLPETVSLVSEIIAQWKDTLWLNEQRYIREEDIYGLQTEVLLPSGDRYYAYVYYDDRAAADERNSIHGQVNFSMAEAEKRLRYTDKMRDFFAKRAIIVTKESNPQTGQNFTLSVDHQMVQQAYAESGFFVIVSNRLIKASAMITIARNRDRAEKSFCDVKKHFMLPRTYTHSDATYCGKLFTAFIALILRQSFCWFERHLLASSSETVASVLAELRKYKILQKKDGSWVPVYAMNKKQKALLAAVHLTEEEIEAKVSAL